MLTSKISFLIKIQVRVGQLLQKAVMQQNVLVLLPCYNFPSLQGNVLLRRESGDNGLHSPDLLGKLVSGETRKEQASKEGALQEV